MPLNEQDAVALLARHPPNVPRYTSYPPANHFTAGVSEKFGKQFVTAVDAAESVSLYLHVPYCDRLCWFCGCHTKHTLQYAPIESYVGVLVQEMALWQRKLTSRPKLSKIHFGGGSPSLLRKPELEKIRESLVQTFDWTHKTEVSFEIDPTDVVANTIGELVDFGLTRGSIGVQDFDPAVQAAINRPQSFEDTLKVVNQLRKRGVHSINIDALYGLPLQTEERLARTIEKVIAIGPERVALFGYAHVPWMKPHQKLIRDEDLPDTAERFRQATLAGRLLVEAGYRAIGIDHFALPHDQLARAAAHGRLRRNFQGYTDDESDVLLGLGASSVSRFPGGYVQNEVATGKYKALVGDGILPFARGYTLTPSDRMRGWFIERLMCDFEVSLGDVEARFGAAGKALAEEAATIAADDTDGLCRIADGRFVVPEDYRPFVRLVAARFDAFMTRMGQRYSKAV